MNARHLTWGVPLGIAIVSAAVLGYLNIIGSLNQISHDVTHSHDMLVGRVSVDEQRLDYLEKLEDQTRQDQHDFAEKLEKAIETGVKAGRR